MPEIDDLLRDFRADVPPPAPGAAERIVARARGAVLDEPAPAPAPRTRIPRRLALAAAGIAAAVTLVVALSPDGGDGGAGPSVASLLGRAEAAVTPREQILVLNIRLHTTTRDPSVIPEDREREIRMREYVLAGAGDAVATRLLITEGPWADPPTDEDSTILTDERGRLVESRSWTPSGGGLLEVQTGQPRSAPGRVDPTLTGMLRDSYERGELGPVGPRDGDELVLRGDLMEGTCGHIEVRLDPDTFIPRRIEFVVGEVNPRSDACRPGPPVQQQVWTIESQRLEANERNRRQLEVGSWPAARYELNGRQVSRDQLPAPARLE